mmetsp:Transcript_7001/g.17505  ORF Transcript_7001/g.17505 Transcript_7001/m.17505 type:complete len:303 (-) Transcript_7001:107-1015(-)|eukprot:CAMPEP_0117513102 /NCGR_PEP_ID=MMETSP0784-20121206/29376_1 /TAXON_ID=39447 /ORGANISM="" /LENGTH=302 /DNA_ID=CAMNT_0005308847 /DNA_START=17 /DNA_END=925 /DNA_ORIENTATION=+
MVQQELLGYVAAEASQTRRNKCSEEAAASQRLRELQQAKLRAIVEATSQKKALVGVAAAQVAGEGRALQEEEEEEKEEELIGKADASAEVMCVREAESEVRRRLEAEARRRADDRARSAFEGRIDAAADEEARLRSIVLARAVKRPLVSQLPVETERAIFSAEDAFPKLLSKVVLEPSRTYRDFSDSKACLVELTAGCGHKRCAGLDRRLGAARSVGSLRELRPVRTDRRRCTPAAPAGSFRSARSVADLHGCKRWTAGAGCLGAQEDLAVDAFPRSPRSGERHAVGQAYRVVRSQRVMQIN